MKIKDDFNEQGTAVTVFECEVCGREFTVCPAVKEDKLNEWHGCLSTDCGSYDANRDVDALMFFGVPIIKE